MGLPFAKATFPLTQHDFGSLGRFRLHHGEYQHEYAVLTLNSTAAVYPDLLTGSPVVVEYGTSDRSDVFCGYVAMVKPSASPRQTAPDKLPSGYSADVHCIGVTFPMKEARQQVFQNLSAEKMAYSIGAMYQLDVFAEPHYRVWPVFGQPGLSDWQLLVKLAHNIGYTLVAKNAQIRMHSRLLEVNRGAADALIYDFTKSGNNSILPDSRQIIEFSPVISNMSIGDKSRARRVVYDLDRRSGRVIAVEDRGGPISTLAPMSVPPMFTEFVSGLSSDTLQEASAWLDGIGEDQRWYVTAEATVQGDVGILPAHLLFFRNLPADFSGYWYVTSVVHDIQLNPGSSATRKPAQYTCHLSVGRDGFGESVGEPTNLPQREVTQLADLGVPSEVRTTAALTGAGYWRANFMTTTAPVN